ncbi:MAG: hypothetical protein U1E81_08190 [Xanthobacteraceae bacterium]
MTTQNGLPLSRYFTDPLVRAAFERAERDQGEPMMAVIETAPRLIDGASVAARELELA